MGMYNTTRDEDFGIDMDALVEAFLIDDLTHNYGEDTIKEFCAPGGIGEALLEAKVLSSKQNFMRMTKESDAKRRKTIAAIQMARSSGDPLYDKLVKYQMLRKETRNKIVEKYGNKAERAAIKGQKEYIKAMKNVNISNNPNAITKDPNR